MDKKSILYRLGNTTMKWPNGLRKYIYNSTDYKTTKKCGHYYVNILEMWRGRLLMRTFAYKVTNKGKRIYNMPVQEVCRRLEGEKSVLLCNVECNSLSGRRVFYSSDGRWITERRSAVYYPWYTSSNKNGWFEGYNMFDVSEWINKLNVPYCGYLDKNYVYKIPFFQYYELYKRYPKIELLAKSGWGHLIPGARYFNFNGKSFEQIFKIKKSWIKYMDQLFVSDILLIRKGNIDDLGDLNVVKQLKRYSYIKKYYSKRMSKYLQGKIDLHLYNDYLRFCEEIGMDMSDNRVLYVKNLQEAHDDVAGKVVLKKSEGLQQGFAKTAQKLAKYRYSNNNFIIIPAETVEDLINESKALCHCVRNYAGRVAQGKTGIMLLREADKIDTPLVTIELKGKEVLQVRGLRNGTPPENIVKFVKQWEKKFKLHGY